MDKDILKKKSFAFAIRIVRLYQFLIEKKKEYVLAKQILRSGTSIGANVQEAHGGISKADFSAKVSIAYKESKETQYWIQLLHETDYIDTKLFDSLLEDCEELSKMLFSILKTTRIK